MKIVFAALLAAVGSTLSHARLIALLWLLNAAVAYVLAGPLLGAVDASVRHQPEADGLFAAFDDEMLVDFRTSRAAEWEAFTGNVRGAALPWIVLSSVLSLGVLAQLVDRSPPGLLAACGRFGHRAAWLLATTLGALWALSFVNDGLSSAVTDGLLGGVSDASAATLGWSMTAKSLALLLLAGALLTAQRIARLRMVLADERCAPLCYLRALGSVLRHPLTFGTAAILSLVPLALVMGGYAVASEALLASDAWLPGMHLHARMLLLFAVTQLGIQAALVYRTAVDARLGGLLWPAAPGGPDAPSVAGTGARSVPGTPRAPMSPAAAPAAGAARVGGAVLLLGLGLAGAFLAWRPAPDAEDASIPAAPAAVLAADDAEPVRAASHRLPVERVRYTLDVTLDLHERTAAAQQQATFVNTTSEPVPELWMHLYAAAFSNEHTLYMRDGALTRRGPSPVAERGEEQGGYIDIRSVRLGGVELGDAVSIAGDPRDAGHERDATLMRVRLPEAVPPGESVTLEIEFVTRFPRIVARMGAVGLHIDGMQWFPKFCAHDEDGWRKRPFFATGEFFADFGRYDVTFTWPASLEGRTVELEATGVPHDLPPRAEGLATRRYLAADVHDFAFTVDPAFVRVEREWTAPDGRIVPVVYLCQPYALPKAELVLDAMLTFLDRAAEWWMPYPWPRLVIDGLPSTQGGGMEYPMLFTINQRQPNHFGPLTRLTEDPLSVTAHEFSHQYWYGILASDEVEEAWLDEGVTTWSTARLLEAWRPVPGRTDALTFLQRDLLCSVADGAFRGDGFGPFRLDPASVVGWRRSPFRDEPRGGAPSLLGFSFPGVRALSFDDMGVDRLAWGKSSYVGDARVRPLSAPSRDFTRGYGSLVYRKTALALATLEAHLGTDGMRRVMGRYVDAFAFRHPTGDDFLGVIEAEGGRAPRELFEQLVRTTGTVDFAVEEVSSVARRPLLGFRPQQRPGDPVDWVARDAEGASDPGRRAERPFWERWWSAVFATPFPGDDAVRPEATEATDVTDGTDVVRDAPPLWDSRYVVRQLGEIVAPVEIEARFADGTVQRETWDGRGGYRIVRHESHARLSAVVVDPEGRFAIDVNILNNGHRLAGDTGAVLTLQGFVHFWTQNHLAAWQALF